MWALFHRFKVREHERGLLFEDRNFKAVLGPGRHFVWDPLLKVRVDVVSVRDAWLAHKDLDVIAKSGALRGEAKVVDLRDHERAVVWVDVIQLGVYIVGGVATLGVATHLAGGGAAFARAWTEGKLAVFDFRFSWSVLYTFWGGLVGGALLTVLWLSAALGAIAFAVATRPDSVLSIRSNRSSQGSMTSR